MTQEVQPLTWQKRTNLEEHQQFFSKINEIIANLAPTVNEAEAAIAQATQAINTANAASANADAASQQAQTAADTVAGYDVRMTAVESKNTQQDTAITALQTADTQDVKLTGAQNITGIKTVPTESTGVRSQQIANSAKVGAELDNYDAMVRTTGNQTIAGEKTFTNPMRTSNYPILPISYRWTNNSGWKKLYSWSASNVGRSVVIMLTSRSAYETVILTIGGNMSSGVIKATNSTNIGGKLKAAYNTVTAKIEVYASTTRCSAIVLLSGISNSENQLPIEAGDQTEYDEPIVGETFAWVNEVTL